LTGCTAVGPDFETPEATVPTDWQQSEFSATAGEQVAWWQTFSDPVLDSLVESAYRENYSLEIAGLRVLEARAQLGIAVGSQFPQLQQARGGATYVAASKSTANTAGGDLRFWEYDVGADVSWEIDFWGRFRRGIESADANLLASVAAYDDAIVLLTAQVAATYIALREAEEQLRVADENVKIQRRSVEITQVRFREGDVDQLDVEQAKAQLYSTQATIPALEIAAQQARHALSTLLARPPGDLADILGTAPGKIPEPPETIAVGVPADLLRRRPDVRQAELQAAAQSARVGVAEADLYPSFGLGGSLGLAAGSGTGTTRTGESGADELFDSDSVEFAGGPFFTWNLLNYGRIRNNVRVQDARLQQLIVNYKDTVLRAAQEVEDAMVSYLRSREQETILLASVTSARRSLELSQIRYREGLSGFQRVLDAQQSLFGAAQRYVSARSQTTASVVGIYRALGGGWESRQGKGFVDEATLDEMAERTDWGGLLEPGATDLPPEEERDGWRSPDW
jgi:NodT family efflux transporter outer membrane factor (OMF) lipoprotein